MEFFMVAMAFGGLVALAFWVVTLSLLWGMDRLYRRDLSRRGRG